MDVYAKPYLQQNGNSCKYVYDAEILKHYSAFEIYIMDGGAKLFSNDIFGESFDGDTAAEMAMNGNITAKWTINGKFDWDAPYKLYCNSKVPAPLEWLVWINRLYFLIPLANKFFKTKEEKYIEKWYEYFEDWWENHPYIEMQENDAAIRKSVWSDDKNTSQTISESEGYIQSIVWRDMQVTWRLLAVVHSIAMMSESETLTKEKWNRIYEFLKLHAEQLLIEGKKYSKTKSLHNHVLHMGTALIYIGCLFPEIANSEEYLSVGKELIEIQLKGAIDSDGGSDETCISYSHFIVRLYIECYLLLKNNEKEPIAGLLESIQKQYSWIYQMSDSNGRTVLFNDSYSMSSLSDIEIASKLIPLSTGEKSTCIFTSSKCGVLRNKNFEVHFDGMDLTQVHQHAGRPNVIVCYKGEPVIVDSGCCAYDNHGLYKYLLSEWAHNSVCIHTGGIPDLSIKNIDSVELIEYSSAENPFVVFNISGSRNGISFSRTRKIILFSNKVEIEDAVCCNSGLETDVVLHLPAVDLTHKAEEKEVYIHQQKSNEDIRIAFTGDVKKTEIDYKPAVDNSSKYTYSPVVIARGTSTKSRITTTISNLL